MTRALIALARWILLRLGLIRVGTLPVAGEPLPIDRGRLVFYALHVRQLSAFIALDEATRQLGLPRAAAPAAGEGVREPRASFFLTRRGQPSPLRPSPYRYSRRLARLIAAVRAHPSLQVQIVPVSVFFGRAPAQQDSLIKALFADAWAAPGPIGQAVRLLVHGRQTLVKFGHPIDVRSMLPDATGDTGAGRDLRRVARLLRAEFRRERELAVGPNLSHRHTVVNQIVESAAGQRAIRAQAERSGESLLKAELAARRILVEIASDYSYPFIRAYDIALTAFWNKLYEGVAAHRFETIADVGAGAEIVYLPCHRSHIDYLLLSYVIYHRGLLPPHVAAGVNLNLPVVGSLLRRGGAFFLRRSFKGDPLYGELFAEYLHTMLQRGFPIEYFVEGGRSRTGLTLPAKAGLLAMTVDSYLRDSSRPVVFLPVYIGYEQLMEADSYAAELAGRPKQKESLPGLLRALRGLRRRRFGKVHVAIGEPIRLAELLDARWPEWRRQAGTTQADGPRQAAIGALAEQVVTRINDALVVNPINLFATAMLGAPAGAMDAARLAEQIELLRALLLAVPYSPLQVVSELDGPATIDYAAAQGLAQRQPHPLGDIVSVPAAPLPMLTYYRNNVMHAFAEASLLACVIVQAERIEESSLLRACLAVQPFLRAELFLSSPPDALPDRLSARLAFLADRGLVTRHDGVVIAPSAAQPASITMHGLARVVRLPLQRSMIVASTLDRFEPGSLSRASLEACAWMIAQRVALLGAGELAQLPDRPALRSIVSSLVELGHATQVDDRLRPADSLAEVARHATLTLPADARLAISHAVQQPLAELLAAADAPAGAAAQDSTSKRRR